MKRYLTLLLSLLLLTGCSAQETPGPTASASTAGGGTEKNSVTVFAMDTVMDISAYGASDALLQSAEERVKQLESLLSVTDESSEIYQLDHTGQADLSPDTAELLGDALELCGRTGGALDISIYPVLREWGFTTGEYQIPSQETLKELLREVDYRRVELDGAAAALPEGMEVDLGSVAKGYTGDQLCALLKEGGVTSGMLNLGGNVQVIGSKPDGSAWRVAVQDPEGDDYLGVLELRDKAAITSGGYERYFVGDDGQTYWHIIDPATGAPARSGLTSVTIVGDRGVVCDALSTALFVMGLERASDFWRQSGDFEAVLVADDGSVYITKGLEDCFFLTEENAQRTLTVIS